MEIFKRFIIHLKKSKKHKECLLWSGWKNDRGYGFFEYKGRAYRAHRISYEFFNGPIKEGLCVMHICDEPRCINPKHLKIGTHTENMSDMANKRRGKSGAAKLREKQIKEIRNKYKQGIFSQSKIGKMYGVSGHAISEVVRYKTWKYI